MKDLGHIVIKNPIYQSSPLIDRRMHAIFTTQPNLEYVWREQVRPRQDRLLPIVFSMLILSCSVLILTNVHLMCPLIIRSYSIKCLIVMIAKPYQ